MNACALNSPRPPNAQQMPIGVVDLAPPVGVVELTEPVSVVNLTPPVVVELAPHRQTK